MEVTYTLEAVVLNRFNFREHDSKVVLYSREKGKLELVARGTKKIKSKIAGHIEPLNLVEAMVIQGRQYDYLGSAVSRHSFANIKTEYYKVILAGRVIGVVNQILKPGIVDERIYFELIKYLRLIDVVNNKKANFLTDSFLIKFLSLLGYRPEIYHCTTCRKKITPGNNRLNISKGGLVCADCTRGNSTWQINISDDCIKIWRLAITKELSELAKVKISDKLSQEFSKSRSLYFKYIFDNITK